MALDAERASGYRYGQRAYLVQLRREGSGTWLIDPIALPRPRSGRRGDRRRGVDPARRDPGPAVPRRGRPAAPAAVRHRARRAAARAAPRRARRRRRALPRAVAGQGALGRRLVDPAAARAVAALRRARRRGARRAARPHGGRPRPPGQGRAGRARSSRPCCSFTGPSQRVDPWRRTSGMHRVRQRRGAAIVRELWETRDRIAHRARRLPRPGAARRRPRRARHGTRRRASATSPAATGSIQRYQRQWLEAVRRAQALPEADLPPLTLRSEGPPPPRAWADRDPVAAARLTATRAAADGLRRGARRPRRERPVARPAAPGDLDPTGRPVGRRVRGGAASQLGARQWQVDIVAPMVAAAFEAPSRRRPPEPCDLTVAPTGSGGGPPLTRT